MRIVGTHHISLLTSNFASLHEFYVETLGLPIVGGFPGQKILFIDAGSILIELEEVAEHSTPTGATGLHGQPGWNHIAFEVEDVDAAFKYLTTLGIRFQVAPQDFPEGAGTMRIAFFSDPDGNTIELLQPLAGKGYIPE
jgi:catechol 2,3-dioxygenase-like lactoylglutathione lyase family enzyme